MGLLLIKIYFKNCGSALFAFGECIDGRVFKNLDSMPYFEKPTSVILALPNILVRT